MAEVNLTQALTVCDKEPVHIPGCIQQHGVLIVADDKDFNILQVSSNTLEYLGVTVEEVLSKNLKDLLGSQLDLITAEIKNNTNNNGNPFSCTLKVGEENHAFDLAVHRNENLLLFEFEHAFKRDELYINHLFYQRAREVITAIPHQDDSKKLLEEVAKEVRRITKFDRVLIYKFHEDEHGEVVAESKEGDVESLLGLHYPASDIPKQARSLYLKNLFRIIPDVNYVPVPIVPTINPLTNAPLDLSNSFLRSVSPIHVQYMKNMGLKASMSISIVHQDRLWGLISCHNFCKRYLPYELRMACTFIGQILSWHLATVLANERSRELMERRNIMNQLIASMANNENWLEGLSKEEKLLCSIMNSSGVSIHLFGLYFHYGATPSVVTSLHHFFEEQMASSKTHIMSTEHIASILPAEQPDVCSGVLSCLIPGEPNGSMIWYRPQVVHTVQWAGKPIKLQEGEMLTPRRSFAIWEEIEKNRCSVWSDIDKIVAEEFRILTLETLVKHETHRLKAAEAHNRRRDEFVDTICHEIRNPINGIIGSINIIKDKLTSMKRKLEEDGIQATELVEVDSHLDDILDCAIHQNIVTEDALDLSKLDYGKLKLDKAPINIENLVMTVVRMLKNAATQKDIEIKTEKLSHSTFLTGDTQRIKQILINLVVNAIKFTDEGSITVSFGEESRDDKKVYVAIAVKDTGVGITEQEIACLFTKFSQPNEEISKKLGGSGLGLFICKKLANLMGGDIEVTSTPNVGSTFTLKLSSPLLTSKEMEQLQGPPIKKAKKVRESLPEVGVPAHVLIVEDNIINQRILASILRKLNFTVIVAKNGIEAVQQYMLHGSEISGILMDIEMPGMNGYDATAAIRKKEKELKLPPVPIVGVSGNARSQWKSKAIETGMSDFITKPFSKDCIVQKVYQFFRNPPSKPVK